jgi:hypothetical protein
MSTKCQLRTTFNLQCKHMSSRDIYLNNESYTTSVCKYHSTLITQNPNKVYVKFLVNSQTLERIKLIKKILSLSK